MTIETILINFHKRMLPDPARIEHATSWSPVRHTSHWTTETETTWTSFYICILWLVFMVLRFYSPFNNSSATSVLRAFMQVTLLQNLLVTNESENTYSNRQGTFSSKKCWYLSYFSKKRYVVVLIRGPPQDASNEYPQHTFSWRNKKNIMWIPPLICSYDTCENLTVTVRQTFHTDFYLYILKIFDNVCLR